MRLPYLIMPILDLVLVAHMNRGTQLDGERPQGLHRLALHALLETFEALDVLIR